MDINYWDLDIPKYGVVVLLGRRRTGKSFLLRDIVYKHYYKKLKVKNILCITATGSFNQDYKWCPERRVVDNFTEELLEELLSRQKKLILSGADDCDLLICFDDIVNMETTNRNNVKILGRLWTSSFHYRIHIIFNTQYIKADCYTPVMRDNTSILVCFLQNNKDNIKSIKDGFLSASLKPEDEETGYELVATIPDENHRVLIINNQIITKEFSEYCYWYKADEIPKTFKYEFG